MKKTLIVSALVVAFAGVAQAEPSVTLYGIVDAGVGYKGTKTTNYINDTSSRTSSVGAREGVMKSNRWGIKGSEDLGNGTSAIFQLESGFSLADGTSKQNGRLFGRKAIIGLTSKSWGTFTIGRDVNAGDQFLAPIDPFGTNFDLATTKSAFGNVLLERLDGIVKYLSPTMGGFQFEVGYISGDGGTLYNKQENEDGSSTRNTSGAITFGAGYTAGPLYIGGTYDYFFRNTKDEFADGDSDTSHSDGQQWNLGLTYDLDVVKLYGMYGQQYGRSLYASPFNSFDTTVDWYADLGKTDADKKARQEQVDLLDSDGFRGQAWMVGVSAPVGDSGKAIFSYQGNVLKNGKYTNEFKNKGHIFSLGYIYSLSKRTSLYAVAGYGWSNNYYDGDKASKMQTGMAIVGLNHNF